MRLMMMAMMTCASHHTRNMTSSHMRIDDTIITHICHHVAPNLSMQRAITEMQAITEQSFKCQVNTSVPIFLRVHCSISESIAQYTSFDHNVNRCRQNKLR